VAAAGGFTAVMGPSGSGKSTLLHCVTGLDRLTSGEAYIDGSALHRMNDTELTKFRRTRLGFVFQSLNLVPLLSAQENIVLPAELAGMRYDREWFNELVGVLGLGRRLKHRPNQLSGGQQQRVAIARALLTRPALVVADEPTGALDTKAAHDVLQVLRKAVDDYGQSTLMVTHDPVAASFADRVVFIADGQPAGELLDPSVDAVLQQMRALAR